MKYYIEKNDRVDMYGKVTYTWYTIKWLEPRFFGLYTVWKYQKRPDFDGWVKTQFHSIPTAQKFIDDVLCNGRIPSTTVKSVVSESECK